MIATATQDETELAAVIGPASPVDVAVAESRALQQIRGEHLVRTDGTVGLGVYGSVQVDGGSYENGSWLVGSGEGTLDLEATMGSVRVDVR